MTVDPAAKFDPARAGEYDQQSRIALAGYDACHELAACVLAAALEGRPDARLLVVGAGTAQEVLTIGALEASWRFIAVDPAPSMIELARRRIDAAGLGDRTVLHQGHLDDLPAGRPFDAATLIGVLHHLPGLAAKEKILADIAARLAPGAPFILAGNYRAYASEPLLLAAWRQRWRLHGATPAEIEAKLARIQHGAEPPASEAAVEGLLAEAGFGPPTRFFASLFWGAWVTRRTG